MTTSGSQIIDVEALGWHPVSAGVEARPLWVADDNSRRVLFIRFSPGAALDRHVHDGDEVQYVLEGSVGDDHGTIPAGNVGYRPSGCTHTVRSVTGGTTVAFITGGVKPVADGETGGPPSVVIDVDAVPEVKLRPGIFAREVWSDPAGERKALVVRYEPGATIPRHRHVGDEFVYVLSGTLGDESGVITAGNAGFRHDGCDHTVTTTTGATVFAVLRGGVEPVEG